MNNTNDQRVSYEQRIGNELHIFNSCSKIHDLPPIAGYWSRKFLSPRLLEHGFREVQEFFAKFLQQEALGRGRPLFASLGAADCHVEILPAAGPIGGVSLRISAQEIFVLLPQSKLQRHLRTPEIARRASPSVAGDDDRLQRCRRCERQHREEAKFLETGTPERIRTSDLLLRRQTLYPG